MNDELFLNINIFSVKDHRIVGSIKYEIIYTFGEKQEPAMWHS